MPLLLPCNDKSKLIHALENTVTATTDEISADRQPGEECEINEKIAVIDGMVFLQKLSKKAESIVTVLDLSAAFNESLIKVTRQFDEIIVVFDTYRTESLNATQEKKGERPCSVSNT